jgi:hypothetical protein
MAWQRTRVEIPPDYSPQEREEIAFEILEYIRNRTAEGKAIGGRKRFPPYSKAYQESLEFKIAGKGTTPDLKLSGDMLDAMDLLSHSKGSLLLGFENGSEENGRAEGNQLGTYGQKSPNSKKARPFLGVTETELKRIIAEYERSR